jgi:Ni2+-binding GTPase involved in maturation of urease and hydrogenase
VIDVAEGEDPAQEQARHHQIDFLVINKTDLAPYVGASLEVMERDTNRMRPERPWTFSNLKKEKVAGRDRFHRRARHVEVPSCADSGPVGW